MNVTGNAEYIGGTGKGVFTQTGGSNQVESLSIGAASPGNGTYNLNGGLLQINSVYLAGNAAFNLPPARSKRSKRTDIIRTLACRWSARACSI